MYADAVNAAIRDVPDDMTVAIHHLSRQFQEHLARKRQLRLRRGDGFSR